MNGTELDCPEPYGHIGIFRITKVQLSINKDGKTVQHLCFENYQGTYEGTIVRCPITQPRPWVGSYAELTLWQPLFSTDDAYKIQDMRLIPDHQILNGAELLPNDLIPLAAQEAVSKLVRLNESLTQPALRHFLTQVLLDPMIGPAFLRCKASLKHHHNFVGGLLVHSIDVAICAARMAREKLTREEIELVAVASLFHDIGKLRTVGEGVARPSLGHCVRHEYLTASVLGRHLEEFRHHWPEGAATMYYMWDFQNRHPEHRGYAKFMGAECLVWADQLSVAFVRNRSMRDLLATPQNKYLQRNKRSIRHAVSE